MIWRFGLIIGFVRGMNIELVSVLALGLVLGLTLDLNLLHIISATLNAS